MAASKEAGSCLLAYHALMRTTSEGTDESFSGLLSRLKSGDGTPAEPTTASCQLPRSTSAPAGKAGTRILAHQGMMCAASHADDESFAELLQVKGRQ
mmetsp:Transcript_21361/g.50637  ORF Transcript_21361/g.50637 Transcript_21361/m.50637 type:complete len:97 (+) Transcript_21361:152-442(+)